MVNLLEQMGSDTLPGPALRYKPKRYIRHSKDGYEIWKRFESNPRITEVKHTKRMNRRYL
jgi:hypothetical protein